MKIKLKEFYPIIKINETTLQIGDEPNHAFEIEDPEGVFAELIPLLTGEFNLNEISRKLSQIDINDLKEIVYQLNELKLLEFSESQIKKDYELSEWELTRYKGNLNFFNIFNDISHSRNYYQKNLVNSNVVVLGMGGLGSNLLMQLAGLGVGKITVLEYDEVELKNLNRQILYSEDTLGQSKLEVGINRLRSYNSSIDFKAIRRKISSVMDLKDVIDDKCDFVFCAADTPPTLINLWVNEVCVNKKIPFISGGVGLATGSFYSVLPGITPCLRCHYEFVKKHHLNELEAFSRIDMDYNSAIGCNISLIASMITMEYLRIHLGIASPIASGRKVIYNFLTAEITHGDAWEKWNQCNCSFE